MKNYTVTVVTTETAEVLANSYIEAQCIIHEYCEDYTLDKLSSYKHTVMYSAEEKEV